MPKMAERVVMTSPFEATYLRFTCVLSSHKEKTRRVARRALEFAWGRLRRRDALRCFLCRSWRAGPRVAWDSGRGRVARMCRRGERSGHRRGGVHADPDAARSTRGARDGRRRGASLVRVVR